MTSGQLETNHQHSHFTFNFRRLGTACKLYLVAYLFDNDMTVLFAFVISVWGKPILIISIKTNHN